MENLGVLLIKRSASRSRPITDWPRNLYLTQVHEIMMGQHFQNPFFRRGHKPPHGTSWRLPSGNVLLDDEQFRWSSVRNGRAG
jgi:hypothetical protein